jgi:hypothetical protein
MTEPGAPRELPFQLEGSLPFDCRSEMAAFAEAAAQHPWGGGGPGRVVVSEDLVGDYQRLMPPTKFREWWGRQEARRQSTQALGVGMAFEAQDGIITAVFVKLGTKDQLLWLFGHEFLEGALAVRAATGGYPEPVTPEENHARALWDEYVVERTRREIAAGLGWPPGDLDRSFLTSSANDVLAAPPSDEASWYPLLAIDFAKCAGRADAGVEHEAEELNQFFGMSFPNGSWRAYLDALRGVYAAPEADPSKHDQAVWQAWADIWTER